MATDFYDVLGVRRDAGAEEIKRAYRRLARDLHPDANPTDAATAARFREVAEAYEVLSDPQRRDHYDRFGSADPRVADVMGGGLGDLFDAFFGGGGQPFGGRGGRTGPPPGADIEAVLALDLEAALFGAEESVEVRTAVVCTDCEATGAAPGTHATTCPDCQGAGQVRRVRQSILGQMMTSAPCGRCGGRGEVIAQPCPTCRGEGRLISTERYRIDVPAGVDDGSTLRLSGRGAVGPRGGPAGDLYVRIQLRPHERLQRRGADLYELLHVSMLEAALGAHRTYATLDGAEDLVIPAGTQSGRIFRLRGRGAPRLEGRGRGDLLVEVVVDTPVGLSAEEEKLLRQLAELREEDVAPPDDGFLSRIRSAFR